MNTKEIPAATEEVAEIFSLYCSDKLLSDDTPAFALYLAGYQAAASRQEAKIKALRNSLNWALGQIVEEPYEWTCCENGDAHRAAIELAKETP